MSTFDGIVDEFPDIRIDYFRIHPNRRPPAACFLSHVHSDHLLGLDSLKMPFVYCSRTTRNILLRMEKYPHRINFQKGILETRKQTYKHLKMILRPLPLHTPIQLELDPKTSIQVTLFDANHCPGSVMFLVEGDGKAILYTGDVRAESWWVNSIMRSPVILPYACGLRRLDCIYLDTTFASHNDIYKDFPSKEEGLAELLAKVGKCPEGSTYYFRAWTLGYEDVWIALGHYLQARVHVDDYQHRLYSAVAEHESSEATALVGAQIGNSLQPGYLTGNSDARIHSCEPGMECHSRISKNPNVVWITPIISRTQDGTELLELGAGGGGGDLYQSSEFQLNDVVSIEAFEAFCRSSVVDKSHLELLLSAVEDSRHGDLVTMSLEGLNLDAEKKLSILQFVGMLSSRLGEPGDMNTILETERQSRQHTIHFPYSRHSSLSELRHLVSRFQPRDICPCTVDVKTWSDQVSMEFLFGDLCSEKAFKYDARVRSSLPKASEQGDDVSGRKGKRSFDSQETASQDSQVQAADDECILEHVSSPSRSQREVIVVEDDEISMTDGNTLGECDTASEDSLPLELFDPLQTHSSIEFELHRGNSRRATRRRAFRAARSYLDENNIEGWCDLRLRSMGWKGHSIEEPIL